MSSKKDQSPNGKPENEDTGDIEIVEDETRSVSANAETDPGVPAAAKQDGGATSQIDELKKQHLYLLADFDNYRKQAIRERSDLIKYGNEPIVRELLGVLDNLERAAGTPVNAETLETYKSGVDMIVGQFKKTLERFGVEEVDPKGQAFDPSMHEALGADNNPDFPPNTVTQVLKKAYKLRGKNYSSGASFGELEPYMIP